VAELIPVVAAASYAENPGSHEIVRGVQFSEIQTQVGDEYRKKRGGA